MQVCAAYPRMSTKQGGMTCFHYLVLKRSADELSMHVFLDLHITIENAIFMWGGRPLLILCVAYGNFAAVSQTVILCSI